MKFRNWGEVREWGRRTLPLGRLLQQLGCAPDKGKNYRQCPICGARDCSGVYTHGGQEFFKCHHTSCSTGNISLTEATFLQAKTGMNAQDAFWDWLKRAGMSRQEVIDSLNDRGK